MPSLRHDGWWIWVQNILCLALIVAAPLDRKPVRSAPIQSTGWACILLGAAAGILGVRALGANRTAHPRPRERARLVRTGVYSLVRHPLYTSLILVGGGWVLVWGSSLGAVFWIALVLLLDQKARKEEHYLKALHPEYVEYSRRVRRFLPGLY